MINSDIYKRLRDTKTLALRQLEHGNFRSAIVTMEEYHKVKVELAKADLEEYQLNIARGDSEKQY